MKYNPLGRTEITVSEICLGTMTWGSQNTEAEGHEQMDYAVEQGVNFFDTAELYPVTPLRAETYGDTERIIGSWFAKRQKRDDIILATKVAGPGRPYIEKGAGYSPGKIKRACEKSLQRLKTDYIDLYQIHWPNRAHYHFRHLWNFAPEREDGQKAQDDIQMILEALAELIKEGKIRHVGLSNETAWGSAQYVKLAEASGLPRPVSIQNEYSLLNRLFDLDLAEVSVREDVGLLAFSPLAAGILSGKYADGAVPEGSRMTLNPDMNGRYTTYSKQAIDAYLDIAARHGLVPSQMAIAYCLQRAFMTSAIIGATSMPQLKENIGAKDVSLSEEVLTDIAGIYRQWPMPI